MKHTKGPWVFSPGKRFVLPHIGGSDGKLVTILTTDTRPEDARLMAAAPELLEALTTLQAWCIESIHNTPLGDKVAAAIAKATGN